MPNYFLIWIHYLCHELSLSNFGWIFINTMQKSYRGMKRMDKLLDFNELC